VHNRPAGIEKQSTSFNGQNRQQPRSDPFADRHARESAVSAVHKKAKPSPLIDRQPSAITPGRIASRLKVKNGLAR